MYIKVAPYCIVMKIQFIFVIPLLKMFFLVFGATLMYKNRETKKYANTSSTWECPINSEVIYLNVAVKLKNCDINLLLHISAYFVRFCLIKLLFKKYISYRIGLKGSKFFIFLVSLVINHNNVQFSFSFFMFRCYFYCNY